MITLAEAELRMVRARLLLQSGKRDEALDVVDTLRVDALALPSNTQEAIAILSLAHRAQRMEGL